MTIREWLSTRTPPAPDALRARIEQVLADHLDDASDAAPEVCLRFAESLLRDLVSRESAGRDSALDLLTADALATYAFEAASEAPATIRSRADDAMFRLSAVAGNPTA
ncbi:MAG TPA: hypothetical protein VF159_12570 [Gemmatimonadaceae bacterium]